MTMITKVLMNTPFYTFVAFYDIGTNMWLKWMNGMKNRDLVVKMKRSIDTDTKVKTIETRIVIQIKKYVFRGFFMMCNMWLQLSYL